MRASALDLVNCECGDFHSAKSSSLVRGNQEPKPRSKCIDVLSGEFLSEPAVRMTALQNGPVITTGPAAAGRAFEVPTAGIGVMRQHLTAHLRTRSPECPGQEMRGLVQWFERTEDMLDRTSTDGHCVRLPVEAALHGLQYAFVLQTSRQHTWRCKSDASHEDSCKLRPEGELVVSRAVRLVQARSVEFDRRDR